VENLNCSSAARKEIELKFVRTLLAVGLGGLVTLLVAGNLAIFALTLWAKATAPELRVPSLPGIDNVQAVDEVVWRGAAPTVRGYRSLAAHDVHTVIDLRAEEGASLDGLTVRRQGMRYVHIPLRDGQVPTQDQVDRGSSVRPLRCRRRANGNDGSRVPGRDRTGTSERSPDEKSCRGPPVPRTGRVRVESRGHGRRQTECGSRRGQPRAGRAAEDLVSYLRLIPTCSTRPAR
jgi:hypothetical protein